MKLVVRVIDCKSGGVYYLGTEQLVAVATMSCTGENRRQMARKKLVLGTDALVFLTRSRVLVSSFGFILGGT